MSHPFYIFGSKNNMIDTMRKSNAQNDLSFFSYGDKNTLKLNKIYRDFNEYEQYAFIINKHIEEYKNMNMYIVVLVISSIIQMSQSNDYSNNIDKYIMSDYHMKLRKHLCPNEEDKNYSTTMFSTQANIYYGKLLPIVNIYT